MDMQSGEYWARRFAALEKTQIKSDAEIAEEIDKLYRQAQREIESKISRWYMKFAQNNEISMADAKKLLKQGDLEEFKWSVDEYIQHGENNLDDAFTKQLVNASSKVHISRYESLLTELQATAVSLMGKQETKLTEHLKDAYSKAYRHTAYEIQKGTGIGFRLGGIDEKSLETVLKKPWAADGSNFSDRIWKDKQSLLSELDTQLKRNILLGKGPDEAAAAIAKRFETSKANAYRLIQTESAAISSKAHEDCFHDLDVEEFEIVETLDGHTCPICGVMDGKHFPMSDYAIGVTVPPFHPNCRGTTVPYYADLEGYGERAARNANGEIYFVPADTTYEQWEKSQNEFTNQENGDIILARREKNIGVFSACELPLQKRTVLQVAKKYNVSLDGLRIKVQRDISALNTGFCGVTAREDIGRIDFLPDSFKNEESMLRTIIHEKKHVEQLRKYGVSYVEEHLDAMEEEAYSWEDALYDELMNSKTS